MAKLDKDEAVRANRILLREIDPDNRYTIWEKEMQHMNVSVLNQIHDFLESIADQFR